MKKIIYIILAMSLLGACTTNSKKAESNDAILEKNVEVDTTINDDLEE